LTIDQEIETIDPEEEDKISIKEEIEDLVETIIDSITEIEEEEDE